MTDTAADRDTHEPAPSSDADAANRLAAVGKADKDLVNDLTQTIGPGPPGSPSVSGVTIPGIATGSGVTTASSALPRVSTPYWSTTP